MGQDLMTITHCFSARWVDLGVKHLATLSTGEKIEGPKPLKAALHHLRRVNRQLARRVKGSAYWHGTKAKLGRLHARVWGQRHCRGSLVPLQQDVPDMWDAQR
jgi:transposase